MKTNAKRLLATGTAALVGGLTLALGGVTAANAHVTIAEDNATAGSYANLTFGVPHGCSGSATTKVSIQIPEDVTAVTPTRNSFYDLEKTMAPLDEPFTDGHGNQVTERPAEIVYTAKTPLPNDQRDVFELTAKIPDDAAGETLYFPTVQTCEEGETAWVQIPEKGQDPFELESPSPFLKVVGANSNTDADTTDTAEHASVADAASSSSNALSITALVIGAVGLLVGLIALIAYFTGRKKA